MDVIKLSCLIINLELVYVNPAEVVFALDAWSYLNYHLINIRIKMCLRYITLKAQHNKDVFASAISISRKPINLVL